MSCSSQSLCCCLSVYQGIWHSTYNPCIRIAQIYQGWASELHSDWHISLPHNLEVLPFWPSMPQVTQVLFEVELDQSSWCYNCDPPCFMLPSSDKHLFPFLWYWWTSVPFLDFLEMYRFVHIQPNSSYKTWDFFFVVFSFTLSSLTVNWGVLLIRSHIQYLCWHSCTLPFYAR